jgi:serine/threonine-protein kinase RsbW
VEKLLLLDAADWLENNKMGIVDGASRKIFNIVKSYKNGSIPMDESKETMRVVLGYIIDFLRENALSIENDKDGSFSTNGLVKLEDGIASRRVVYEVDLEDLMRGIRIFRDEIWNLIASNMDDRAVPASEFLRLERRVNVFINFMTARIASSYNRRMTDIIRSQQSDLRKWEEVVKSAQSIELKIPCSGQFVAIVRQQAEAIARRLIYSEDEIHDIKAAVGEACDNAIEHGVSEKGVDVHYHLSPEELQIEVIDYGRGFEPKGMGEEPPDLFSERGRGIFLMKALMDRAELFSKPGKGTMIVLAKKRSHPGEWS